MSEESGQPPPARPVEPTGPAWLRYPSQLSDAEFRDLLSARDRANTATPGLQTALTVATVAAALAAVAAAGVFTASHFRAMDLEYGIDASGNAIGGAVDYAAGGIALLAVAAAVLAFAGVRFDVTARTRALLTTTGAAVTILVGAGVGLLLDPSRHDLQKHFHVGVWGTRASFYRLIHVLDACGWFGAACGVAVLVLIVVQRRRIAAAYPQ